MMSTTVRLLALGCLLFSLSAIVFTQAIDPEAKAALASGEFGYAQKAPMNLKHFHPVRAVRPGTIFDATTGAVITNSGSGPGNGNNNSAVTISTTPIASFDGAFVAQGGPNAGGVFPFTMLGGHPLLGKATNIGAKISEVSLILLNADGSILTIVPYAPFDILTLQSPNFKPTDYGSGREIQFADAVQRAEFFHSMASTWHTNLQPTVTNRVAIVVPRFVNVRLSNGHVIQARSYFIGTAADGNTFVLMLDMLFDVFFGNEVTGEILAGNFTSDALNMTLFPNTFLFALNANKPDTPGTCCVGGFHTFFFDPSATPTPRWVTQYASWISPGLFAGGFGDVTGISHETSEAFNDPFLDNITPIWQFPGQPPKSRICAGLLETGDPIAGLPLATFPVTLTVDGQPFTYHPQTEALLQWFQMGPSSNAISGAFSFPDESALPKSAVPCPKN
jgi:hypothetical protein